MTLTSQRYLFAVCTNFTAARACMPSRLRMVTSRACVLALVSGMSAGLLEDDFPGQLRTEPDRPAAHVAQQLGQLVGAQLAAVDGRQLQQHRQVDAAHDLDGARAVEHRQAGLE